MSECIVDKNTGDILYKPFLPTLADEKVIKEHLKAEDYIMKNGVPSEEYDKYLSWKNRLASTGTDISEITYKDFEDCKLRHFVRVNNWWPQADYNEWNW